MYETTLRLTDRQERILRALVEEYVETARPVGSGTILERVGLHVSSATIRSELALLEQGGFVLQLHTSGGRVPTTGGYRYYIEHLLPARSVSVEEQVTIRHQFHQAQRELDEWLKLAAAVLAHRVHTVALATPPKADVHFRHVELVRVQPHTVLTIVVLADGTVKQELMATDDQPTQEGLRSYADTLNRLWDGGPTYPEMMRRVGGLAQTVRPYAEAVLRVVGRAQEGRLQVYHQGLGEMLSRWEFAANAQPNLAAGERLRRVVDFLQEGMAMEDLLSLMSLENGVQVVIGGETPLAGLEDYALVLGRYGESSEASGVLGVLGPTRMNYGQAISLVRYMTELMSDLIGK
jgi:heat-inducible transcriptional repressor